MEIIKIQTDYIWEMSATIQVRTFLSSHVLPKNLGFKYTILKFWFVWA